METTVSKSEFTPNALKFFRQVETSGKELIITDKGNPVVKIVPVNAAQHSKEDDSEEMLKQFRGMVIKYDDPLEPTGEDWGF